MTLPPDDPLTEPQEITRECVAHARWNLAKVYGAEGSSNRFVSVTRSPYECLNGPGGPGVNIRPRAP